jgi:hypothetical protein
MTTQFEFTSKQRMFLMIGMALGVVCMGLTWIGDDALHTRFWTNYLHNSVFFTGIALMAGFFIAVCITAWAGWHATFKRIWESMSMFLGVGLILMGILAISTYLGMNHLYHWADAESVANDEILSGKASFLNKNWYLIGTFVVIGIWFFLANKIRSLSIAEDTHGGDANFSLHRKQRVYAAIFLPLVGFLSAAMIWQWIMSLDAHWYSTMFAWYTGASWFVSMMCFTVLMLIYLKGKGYFEYVTSEHIHDIGKFIFAFSIFWTYLWFSQYMLIWYANVGEETIYFLERRENYPVLFYGNLLVNFVLPFFVLMRNDTKRKLGSVGFIAIMVFIGHWVDFFLMIKPGALHTAHELAGHGAGHDGGTAGGHAETGHDHVAEHAAHGAEHVSEFVSGFTMPGFLEIGTMIGFLCLFIYVFFVMLSKASLLPEKDPYIEESLHHHV